jgi:spore germination protein YaaH
VDSNKANKEELHGKILLGLPFHGFVIEQNKDKPKMDLLEGNSFGSLISSSEGSLDWDETECEHLIKLNSRNTNSIASYPTKKFFKERLSLSKSLGLGGVAVWDLAQGLESFLDEF